MTLKYLHNLKYNIEKSSQKTSHSLLSTCWLQESIPLSFDKYDIVTSAERQT